MVAFDSEKPADLRVHLAGDRRNFGETAPRGFPQVLSDDRPSIPAGQSGRLELARWLVSPEHPLTARVFVNRVWRHYFGAGLVRTPDNFGRLGDRPSHPELLDWLARRLIDGGWSVKTLHHAASKLRRLLDYERTVHQKQSLWRHGRNCPSRSDRIGIAEIE